MKQALTIAGSDSSAGAGIQADLKTFHAHNVYGTSVVTSVTAQNTRTVTAASDVRAEIVEAQLTSVFDDFDIAATKTGMLPNAEIVRVVADIVADRSVRSLVVDPVIVATTGDKLINDDALIAVKKTLLPLAFLVTPNRHEAERLAGQEISTREELEKAARAIHATGCEHVVITGGHNSFDPATDWWFDGSAFRRFEGSFIESRHTHGTGCTFSAAITARLAKGEQLGEAIAGAKRFTEAAIKGAPRIGHGHGPTHHFFFLRGDESDQ